MRVTHNRFIYIRDAINMVINQFKAEACDVHTDTWQGKDISKRPEAAMKELLNVTLAFDVGERNIETLGLATGANMPWAENHFQERVCGAPINPGVEWKNWPYANKAAEFREPCYGPELPAHEWSYLAGLIDGEGTIYWRKEKERWQGVVRVYQKDRMICDHLLGLFRVGKVTSNNEKTKTNIHGKVVDNHCFYWQINSILEVLWLLNGVMPYLVIKKDKAKEAFDHIVANKDKAGGWSESRKKVWGRDWEPRFNHNYMSRYWPRGENDSKHIGLRHPYGDLNDVVSLMGRDPLTRQAYLPVFFPEDTGAVHGGRVPCTLGYHFIMRDDELHMVYYLRSCDLVRHFRDDIYLSVRLQMWMLKQLQERFGERWLTVKPGSFTMHVTSLHCFVNDFRSL